MQPRVAMPTSTNASDAICVVDSPRDGVSDSEVNALFGITERREELSGMKPARRRYPLDELLDRTSRRESRERPHRDADR